MRGAVGALVGGAAFGVATRVTKASAPPKVLGVRLPNELNPRRLDKTARAKGKDIKKLASHADVRRAAKNAVKDVDLKGVDLKGVDLKGVARRIGDLAEQVENHSEDVQALSRQAKRISRRFS